MPFDRLVRAMDAWAGKGDRMKVFAQIGPGEYEPRHMEWKRFLDPANFRQKMEQADAVVAHAGMGSILTALEFGKPILVLPRRAALRETRNDHQVATADRFRDHDGIVVARDETELEAALVELEGRESASRIASHASDELIGAIRSFIDADPT